MTLHVLRVPTSRKIGLRLVPIPPGSKGPRREGWNKPGGYFTDPKEAARHWEAHAEEGIGAVLGPSGLCSLDVDHVEHARTVLAEFSIDLDALAKSAPCVVGNPARFRVLLRGTGWRVVPSRARLAGALGRGEARYRSRAPGGGTCRTYCRPRSTRAYPAKPYTWRTRPNGSFPAIPEALLTLWRDWPTFERLAKSRCPRAPAPTPTATHPPRRERY